MANLDDDQAESKTTINVKSVRKSAWEAARREAAQRDDSMGTWLSDAIDQRVSRDADQIQPPANPVGNPRVDPGNPPLTADQFTARMMAAAAMGQSIAALKQSTGRATGIGVLRRCLTGLDAQMPLPPLTLSGKADGKETPNVGKSATISDETGKAEGKEMPIRRQPATIYPFPPEEKAS